MSESGSVEAVTVKPESIVDQSVFASENVSALVKETVERSGKNPISLFTEMYVQLTAMSPEMQFETRTIEENQIKFLCFTSFDGIYIEGGLFSQKKKAKLSCALKGLSVLLNCLSQPFLADAKFEEETTIFELMREHTYAKFYDLSRENPEIYGMEKVIASVFIKVDEQLRLITLATGNKCLRGESFNNF
ncbi:unnamed protein product [Caenorhabditis angaria]|uniref:Uncharacterized protein n=1 Tax=Caenorhabditis angaria TaxID=860376 RepID=A0A9P1IK99_9PELO|nr:unnamed protein product [Caenorhabditis angaria]